MSTYTVIRRKHRKANIGDMRERITIMSRTLSPTRNNADAIVDFNAVGQIEVWAMVDTAPPGTEIFSDTNIATNVTHFMIIRAIAGLTQESWIDLKGTLYNILNIERMDGRTEFMRLACAQRGPRNKPVNYA